MKRIWLNITVLFLIFTLFGCGNEFDRVEEQSSLPSVEPSSTLTGDIDLSTVAPPSGDYSLIIERDASFRQDADHELFENWEQYLPDFPVYVWYAKNNSLMQLGYLTGHAPDDVMKYYKNLADSKGWQWEEIDTTAGDTLYELRISDEVDAENEWKMVVAIDYWNEVLSKDWKKDMKGMWENGVFRVEITFNGQDAEFSTQK